MPVQNVLDHWIEVYSADRDATQHADFLFWFGYDAPPDILVTTCLSALTLGVDIDLRRVGTIGTRIHRYVWLGPNGAIRYREIPPSFDWNSERISRCVSVEVRTSVFYAAGTSLSTVYVLNQPVPIRLRDIVSRRVVAYEGGSGKVAHSLDVVGEADELERRWSDIEQHVKTEAARLAGRDAGPLRLLELKPDGVMGEARVDARAGKLVRQERILEIRKPQATDAARPPPWVRGKGRLKAKPKTKARPPRRG